LWTQLFCATCAARQATPIWWAILPWPPPHQRLGLFPSATFPIVSVGDASIQAGTLPANVLSFLPYPHGLFLHGISFFFNVSSVLLSMFAVLRNGFPFHHTSPLARLFFSSRSLWGFLPHSKKAGREAMVSTGFCPLFSKSPSPSECFLLLIVPFSLIAREHLSILFFRIPFSYVILMFPYWSFPLFFYHARHVSPGRFEGLARAGPSPSLAFLSRADLPLWESTVGNCAGVLQVPGHPPKIPSPVVFFLSNA